MFNNIGGKIKVVATVFCWIGIVGSALCGIYLMISGVIVGEGLLAVVIGPVVGVAGAFLSWIMSFGLYGFGQLIENTDILVAKGKKGVSLQKKRIDSAVFTETIMTAKTEELKMILQDQRDLYSDEELFAIADELKYRKK